MDGHVEFRRYKGPYGNTFPVNGAGLLFDNLWRHDENADVAPK